MSGFCNTAKSTADSSGSSTFGQCTNQGFGFGLPSANAFASFGTSSSPPESSRSSPFASPAPGVFGASSSPFGTSKSSTPGFVAPAAFGNASSAFGASVAPSSGTAFGAPSEPFGTSTWSTPGFGPPAATFGTAFGAPSAPFGTSTWSTPGFDPPAATFGNTSSAFGASLAPSSGLAFGASSSSAFGASSAPSSSPAFGAPSAPFGTSIWSTPGFVPPTAPSAPFGTSIWSTPGFVPPTASFPNASSSFLAPSSGSFRTAGSATPTSDGSRITRYTTTPVDGFEQQKIVSISAMKNHLNNSHEELRADDYQLGDKGGLGHASVLRGSTGVAGTQQNHWNFPAATSSTSSHPRLPGYTFTFPPQPSMGTVSNEWYSAPWMKCQDERGPFFSQPSVAMATMLPSVPDHRIPSTPNPFASQTKRVDNSGGTSSTKIDFPKTPFPLVRPYSGMLFQNKGSRLTPYTETLDHDEGKIQSISAMPKYGNKSHEELKLEDYLLRDKGGCKEFLTASTGKPSSLFVSASPANQVFCPPSCSISTPIISTGTSSLLTSNVFQPSQLFPSSAPSTPVPFSFPTPSPFVSSGFSFLPSSNKPFTFARSTSSSISSGTTSFLTSTNSQPLQQSQLAAPSGRLTSPFIGSESTTITVPQDISSSATPTIVPQTVTLTVETQPVIANPPEALNMAQTSVHHPDTILSIQYGISSRPVTDHPSPARPTSLLRVKHLSIGRNRLKAEKCNAKSVAPKVAFFTEEERNHGTLKADSSIISRNNPGCWISSPLKESVRQADSQVSRSPGKTNTSSEDRMSGSANDIDNLHRHNENLEILLPKLVAADYYTEPSISEIAAKEKAEPGFCSRVKDFVVGRVGHGSIKFIGETDVRKLELDSIIKFNHRELLVYFNESMEKPPVGQGLNKPAEATLLEVKCIGSKGGNQYIDGPKVDKCRERLIKKAAEHGAEFISYNPVLGEWKFRVQHF